MLIKFKKFWGHFRCKLGRHDWEEVPFEWKEEGPPGCSTGTNAQCARCPERTYLSWMTPEEAREIYRELQSEAREAQWE